LLVLSRGGIGKSINAERNERKFSYIKKKRVKIVGARKRAQVGNENFIRFAPK
jgi:hypothetical protein